LVGSKASWQDTRFEREGGGNDASKREKGKKKGKSTKRWARTRPKRGHIQNLLDHHEREKCLKKNCGEVPFVERETGTGEKSPMGGTHAIGQRKTASLEKKNGLRGKN